MSVVATMCAFESVCVCSCSMSLCFAWGCFILVTLFFQVVTCYNQSGSVKKKQTLIHSNQILPSMMRLSGVLLG